VPGAVAAQVRLPISMNLPSIAYGTPERRTVVRGGPVPRIEQRTLTAAVGGRQSSARVLNLRGLKAIEQAPVSDGVRRLMLTHVRSVPLEESDHYIVMADLAEQWVKDHPVPDYVKPAKEEKEDCNNWYDSIDCAAQAVENEWKRNWEKAVKQWNEVTGKLTVDWNAPLECFQERTLSLPDIPVRFEEAPTMTVRVEQSGSRGGATGSASGSASLGVPIAADFGAQLDLFYIPCLPFMVRPKALSADGSMSVGQVLTANVTATGDFQQTFTLPPTGGPVIPIQVFPIIIGGVPVSEVDVSLYVEGNMEVGGAGRAEGNFRLANSNTTRFAFSCSGKGCSGRSKGASAPVTTNESVQLEGRVYVKPALYTALQLNFNWEALSARAGPQPYLLGAASGCGALAAQQTAGGGSSVQTQYALTGDLDWGADLRAEALVMRKVVGSPWVTSLMRDRHLWFRDLAPGGSTALTPEAGAPAEAEAGKPTIVRIRMPTCFPYGDRVTYRVSWTGGAVAAPNSAGRCEWQAGAGTCSFDPARDLPVSLTWTAPGTHVVSVTAVKDGHDRTFGKTMTAQIEVKPPPG